MQAQNRQRKLFLKKSLRFIQKHKASLATLALNAMMDVTGMSMSTIICIYVCLFIIEVSQNS